MVRIEDGSVVITCRVLMALLAILVAAEAGASTGFVRTADGCELFVRVLGERGTGGAVVVPGGFLFGGALDQLAEDRLVILYDMRNRGRSCFERRNEKLNLQQDIDDLEAVRRHFGIETFGTIGFSYLGKMVVLYALQHPGRVERIVQIGPAAMDMATEFPEELTAAGREAALDEEKLAAVRALRDDGMHLVDPEEYCRREWDVTRFRLIVDPDNVSRLRESNCEMPNEWPTNLTRHFAHHFPSVQEKAVTVEDLSDLDTPVLTIHGRADRNSPYGAGLEWARSLRNARLLTVEDAAHSAWADEPELIDAIGSFLGGEWPGEAERVMGSD